MASKTAETEFRRTRRHKNMGKARKAKLRNHGTTRSFPIHTPEVDANAPAAEVSPKKA
jgi:hypothetical protein